ncbi:HlyC/CorC family transporter [Clostridia bacterium]|nr:HlyC/CorC family transporter [Clostridia bacterium]
MNRIITQIILLFFLILLNGFFSMTEISIISSKPSILKRKANEGNKRAQTALEMSEKPTLLLSTVQIGITLIGLLAGALGGSSLAVSLSQIPPFNLLENANYSVAFLLVIILTTYFTIVIGELVPKRLGMHNPERVALFAAPIMDRLSRLLKPLVRLLECSTLFFTRLFKITENNLNTVSEEEIRSIVDEGVRSGSIEDMEKHLVHQILDMGDLQAVDIMTPKSQLVWLDAEDTPEHNLNILMRKRHSQYPVVRGGFEAFMGMVSERDYFKAVVKKRENFLNELVYKPQFTPETMEALNILSLFRTTGCRETVVVDEYGDITGLITRKDLLEHIVGEMREADEEELFLYQADGSLLASGLLPISQLKKLLHLKKLPGENEYEFHTLSGFMISALGQLPNTGDSYFLPPYHLRVEEMSDGIKVKWVIIEREIHEKETKSTDKKTK